ncbi:cold-inducible protein YdjO-related protein [Paenibacillus caseinilyticus]|uniref:cold-inducible protein YdjO-related protein n=1 Tax=Paenibacillus mucilaginosus TaxID=61624 RepID=UPI0009DBB586
MNHSTAQTASVEKPPVPFLHQTSKRSQMIMEMLQVEVWKCSNEHCICWMRVGMTFSPQPVCPFCGECMFLASKDLPLLKE